jgi:hypothetical protein
MNPRLAQILTRLYPRWWRQRYAAEFCDFLETDPSGLKSVPSVVWSAIVEHMQSEEEWQMNRSEQRLGLVVVSFLAAIAGGINLVMTVDDSALVDVMHSYPGMSIAWNILAAASIATGIAILAIAIPLYRSMLAYAWKQRRTEILALLSVPFAGFATLVAWGMICLKYTYGKWVPSPWALQDGIVPSGWPSLHVRWICATVTVVLCAVVAIATAISMRRAIDKTNFSNPHGTLLSLKRRYAMTASRLVAGLTLVMSVAALLWGIFVERAVPDLFGQRFGLLHSTAAASWAISLLLFALATWVSIAGSTRFGHAERSV